MTTVPIEVILQDAESPVTPTPESGGETNITVPDTGTISDVNNSGRIGSAISIILPAIIAVLAIGAIVAMLMHKHHKHQNGKLSKKEKLATVASSTIAILAATVLVGNLVIPATKAASDDTGGSSDEGTYLETEDKVTIVATIDKDSKESTIVNVKDILYATTDTSGYTVTMSMIEDALTSNLYLNGDETSQYYIAPVEVEVEDEDESEDTTEGVELAANTWGYRLSEDDGYLPVPIADAPATVAEGEEATEHEEINVYYGLKVDGTLPLGTYSGEIEYNITPVNPIDKLTYMQDFAKLSAEEKTALIAAMPEGKQYILKDFRDKKPYYISRLADGNVWMTQNLGLDLKENVVLTPDDTDISENWTPSTSTVRFSGNKVDGWGHDDGKLHSANPGNVYYYTSGSDADDVYYDTLSKCEAARHTDCIHYSAGNYYEWKAAVAMSGEYSSYSNATSSICPAGWKLPTGPNEQDKYYDEWSRLATSYEDIVEKDITIGCGGNCGYYQYLANGFNNIRSKPLWLVRSGYLNESGNLKHDGDYYWTRTSLGPSSGVATPMISTNGFYPVVATSTALAIPVRCLLR